MTARIKRALPGWPIWAALLIVLILAAVLRLYQFGTFPPGLHYDEAAHLVAARMTWKTGRWPVFYPINFGLEPGYIYLIAILFHFTGPFAAGGRVVSLILGILCIPLTYICAGELLRRAYTGIWRQIGALLAAAQAAFTYWYLNFSRSGYEHMLVVCLSLLAFWLLWRAERLGGLWRITIAGIALGFCLYTYPSARFLPLVPAAWGVVMLLRRGHSAWKQWPKALLYVGAALLAAAPLLYFAFSHPEIYFMRAEQVTGLTLSGLWDSVSKSIGGIFWRGDSNTRYNLAGRPLLDIVQLALLLLGLGTVIHWRKPVSAFILLWLLMMFLPGALSDYPPQFGRLCGILPPLSLLCAIGGVSLGRWLAQRRIILAAAALVLLTLFSAGHTAYDYFVVWPRSGDWVTTFDTGIRLAGEKIYQLPKDDTVYISPTENDHLTLQFTTGEERSRSLRRYKGTVCVVLPEDLQRPVHYYILANEDRRSLDMLRATYPDGKMIIEDNLNNAPYVVRYDVPPGDFHTPNISHRLNYIFAGAIKLRGFDLMRTNYKPGDIVHLRLAWQAQTTVSSDYTAFVQLVGPYNRRRANPLWGQNDSQPCDRSYPTSKWSSGEWLIEERAFQIDTDTPPGQYELHVGWYDLTTGTRLKLADGRDYAMLGKVTVGP